MNQPTSQRLVSLDAYRGFVMLALVSAGFGVTRVARDHEGEVVWDFFRYQFSHAQWTGCSFWDLIQPSFMFIAGVSIPLSYYARRDRGDSDRKLLAHAAYRAAFLILLGVFLRSNGSDRTEYTFEDVVSQIGLGYLFVYALIGRGIRVQAISAAVVLVGYWLLFAVWPLPGAEFNPAAAGIPSDWRQFDGFAAHWNKHANPAGYFDAWFLKFFPETAYTYNGGGYTTLNFVPSMATMLFGLMTGELMRGERTPGQKAGILALAGAAGLAVGFLLDGNIWPGLDWNWSIAPIVKRIWTPSFAVFSTGWTVLILAAFVWVIDVKGYKRWTFPLVVMGLNSITLYVMESLLVRWLRQTLRTHLGEDTFAGGFGPVYMAVATTLLLWLIVYWMYRRRLFIRI